MNYLRSYKIFEANTVQEKVLDELGTDEKWIIDTNINCIFWYIKSHFKGKEND